MYKLAINNLKQQKIELCLGDLLQVIEVIKCLEQTDEICSYNILPDEFLAADNAINKD